MMSVPLKVLQQTRRNVKSKKSTLFDLGEGEICKSPRVGARDSKMEKSSPKFGGSSMSMAGNRRGSLGRRGSMESDQSAANKSPQSMSEIAKMRRKMQDQEREKLAKGLEEFRAQQKEGFSALSVKEQLAELKKNFASKIFGYLHEPWERMRWQKAFCRESLRRFWMSEIIFCRALPDLGIF